MKKLLKKLSLEERKVRILEVGCGMAFTNSFMNLDGASEVLLQAVSPYGKSYQGLPKGTRSVSIKGLQKMFFKHQYDVCATAVVLYIGISVQAGPNKSAHGYIRIGRIHVHFTLPYGTTKATAGRMYSPIVEYAVLKYHFGENPEPNRCTKYIDGVFDRYGEFMPELMPEQHGPFMYFNNKWCRINEYFRPKSDIPVVITKGSFNPLHDGHVYLSKDNLINNPDTSRLFSLTSHTFTGKTAKLEELLDRTALMEYPCIIDSSCVTFHDLILKIETLCGEFTRCIIFPIGSDVFPNIDLSEFEGRNITFSVYPRVEKKALKNVSTVQVVHNELSPYASISSTAIRNNK